MITRHLLLALALACSASDAGPVIAAPQAPFPLTGKLTGLEGTWVRSPSRGAGGICGVNPADVITIAVSATDIAFDAGATSGATATRGIVTLDGSETFLADGRTAAASLDAGGSPSPSVGRGMVASRTSCVRSTSRLSRQQRARALGQSVRV